MFWFSVTLFCYIILSDGWLDASKLGFCVGFNVGHIKVAIDGDLEVLSAIEHMPNMYSMKVLARIKKE